MRTKPLSAALARLLLALCALLTLALAVPLAHAGTLDDLRLWQSAAGLELDLELDAPADHVAFTLDNPTRLVIDLRNTRKSPALKLTGVALGPVLALRSGVRDDGMRLVIDLKQRLPYTSEAQLLANGRYRLRVVLTAPSAADLNVPAPVAVAQLKGAGPLPELITLRTMPSVAAGVSSDPIDYPLPPVRIVRTGLVTPLGRVALAPYIRVEPLQLNVRLSQMPTLYAAPKRGRLAALDKLPLVSPYALAKSILRVAPVPEPQLFSYLVVSRRIGRLQALAPMALAYAVPAHKPERYSGPSLRVLPTVYAFAKPNAPVVVAPLVFDNTPVVVAIDPGHGGKDPGARGGSGVWEKDVCLRIAQALAQRLNSTPGYRALLTRNDDRFLPLRQRTALAKLANADLFISIHANALASGHQRGAAVYVLSSRGASSEHAKLLAQRENEADEEVASHSHDDDVASVLLDISQTAVREASMDLAGRILGAMDGKFLLHKRNVQQAGFAVLKSPEMPAILIETAFLSDPSDEALLSSPQAQRQMAAAIAEGIRSYFKTYRPNSRAGGASPP